MGRRIVIGLIRLYQAGIAPLLPAACRYTPSCSEYAVTAVRRFGALRGGWLAARRILRCHPFGGRGHDPVPPAGPGDGPGDRAGDRNASDDSDAPDDTTETHDS